MNFRRKELLCRSLTIIMLAIGACVGASYAQFTVTLSGPSPSATPNPSPTATPAPSGSFTVSATASTTLTKVVFYRNDVPYETDTSSPYQMTQNQLGQDTYTYRARGYDSSGAWVDSADFKLSVVKPRSVTMGINGIGLPTTTGPSRTYDHTSEIQAAVTHLGNAGGGTLFFPCKLPSGGELQAIYNIKDTINVPANVTLQGESSEWWGRCLIYWIDVDPDPKEEYWPETCNPPADSPPYLHDKPMFRVNGGRSRVRFKDLALFSRASGPQCWVRSDLDNIEDEGTVGIELNTDDPTCTVNCSDPPGGDITDIIFENVGIYDFTYGIKAMSDSSVDHKISGVKIRGYRAQTNHRQLYIDAKYAHDWDVQNLDISAMAGMQGGVEILNAGKPSSYTGDNGELRFLQLNCGGTKTARPQFCVRVEKHGGLYFKQLHHEGVDYAIKVENIGSSRTNPDSIIFDGGVATGKFYDPSMKLYLIGNAIAAAPEVAQTGLDAGRLHFINGGVSSTVIDCGDQHWDWTDADGDPYDDPAWEDLKMLYTHSERNRPSFFADNYGVKSIMPHTVCPSGVSGLPNVNEVGGELFDSGTLPADEGLYINNVLSTANVSTVCPTGIIADCLENLMDYDDSTPDNGGSLYINGSFTVNRTVNVPRGMQIIGAPGSQLEFVYLTGTTTSADTALFRIHFPIYTTDPYGASAIAIRNLKLKATGNARTGIELLGEDHTTLVGVGRDNHFSGLTIEGFETGIYGRLYSSTTTHPMIDSMSMKNMTFINNHTAIRNNSANSSNWNAMNLNVTSSTSATSAGWLQRSGGHQTVQGMTCQGASETYKMGDCVRLEMTGAVYLSGLKRTTNVTNALTIGENGSAFGEVYEAPVTSGVLLRDNDFTSAATNNGRVNLIGKAFITSMNNKYQYFSAGSTYFGDESRVTYCGDTYAASAYPVLDDTSTNLWVGIPAPTRIQCGTRPVPWDDAIRWGGNSGDIPLVGNIYDNVREDFIFYRPGSQSRFHIKQAGGTASQVIDWGVTADIPMIGKFHPSTRAQIVVFRPSTGVWWMKDPNNSANNLAWTWGLSGDVPFVGNFFDESGSVSGNHDEAVVYRPSNKTFYIFNPRSTTFSSHTTTPDNDSKIQVGDFRGSGYDQIAQFKNGTWNILDPRTTTTYSTTFGTTGDVPVAGKYLSGSCTQLGVWRPSTQEFIVADVPNTIASCGARGPLSMYWGSNNDHQSTSYDDDIPLTMNTASGSLRRPTAYRPTVGAFPYSIANGQWHVHDPF